MAAAERESDTSSEKPPEIAACDPRLDFFSANFDPLLALRTPDIKPPEIAAKYYDNLAMYESAHSDKPKTGRMLQVVAGTSGPVRRWLPHQLPVKSEPRAPRRNILTRMESMEGPLSLLKKCKDERLRLKVWNRHSHGIRGYLIAFVTAFDKHWNLALEDVTEVWTRPKKMKVPAFDDLQATSRGRKKRIVPPPIKIIKSDKKLETCQRHVNQLVIRGEHVAFIVVLSDKEKGEDKT